MKNTVLKGQRCNNQGLKQWRNQGIVVIATAAETGV